MFLRTKTGKSRQTKSAKSRKKCEKKNVDQRHEGQEDQRHRNVKNTILQPGFLDHRMVRLVCNDRHIMVTLDRQSFGTVLYTIRDSDYVD